MRKQLPNNESAKKLEISTQMLRLCERLKKTCQVPLYKEKKNPPNIINCCERMTISCIWRVKSKSTSLTFSESMAENVLNSTSFLNRIFIICSIQSQTNKCQTDVHFYNNHKLVYSLAETLNASLTREATSALDTNPPIV